MTVVSDVNNSSLQLVEMCTSKRVWSPVCDNNWTLQDATVVCRELSKGLCRYKGQSYIIVSMLSYILITYSSSHAKKLYSRNTDNVAICLLPEMSNWP